jgi:hypothetical protein
MEKFNLDRTASYHLSRNITAYVVVVDGLQGLLVEDGRTT